MTDPHLEKFAESLSDGAAYATKILSRMARVSLTAGPARIVVAEHGTTPAELFPPGERFQSGIVPLSGDLFGQALLLFPLDVADGIARGLAETSRAPVPAGAALEEAVNIFANSALSSVTRDFKLSVYPLPPKLTSGGADATWRSFVDPIDQPEPRSTLAVVDLSSPEKKAAGRFIVALRRDSLENVRYKAVGMSDKRIDVKMGDMRSSPPPGIIKVTSLGSCLAVILYDPMSKLGAIAHVMLPNCTSPELGRARPGKYADTAVEALLKSFPGVLPGRLRVWLIGGASMFSFGGTPAMQIGQRNVEVIKKKLNEAGIVTFAEDTGGTTGRTVELDTRTGEVGIHSSAGVRKPIPYKTPSMLPPKK